MVTYKQLVQAVLNRIKAERIRLWMIPLILNKQLPADQQIPLNRAGLVSVQRWLQPDKSYHCEPRANIALALYYFAFIMPPVQKWDLPKPAKHTIKINE